MDALDTLRSFFGADDDDVAMDHLFQCEGRALKLLHGKDRLLMSKVVALKEIRLQPEEGTPFTAIREASLLRGLKHANIVTLHDIIHTKDTLTFVFEYVHTDLSQYLEKHPGGLNPKNVKVVLVYLLAYIITDGP
ncbi:hypothetical protein HPB51_021022 [Rhipicephalus microplus]|uniref:Protein kinase domain-containing protein n=1 Tax=Rhipicephalus microplus TaxID=6941 RepID=A0A9J6DC14_RHIMP|nr:hypothetical protein HPB51_021022 [Rhipicephalus microplus]